MDITFHNATSIRVKRTMPSNCNMIELEIETQSPFTKERTAQTIVFYDLPEDVTDKIVLAIGGDHHELPPLDGGVAA